MTKKDKIEKLALLEWEDFQEVNNEGGRASCQDDPETFFIMRKSYLEPFSEEVIDCISHDFEVAHSEDRNLLSEKYAWMMKSTAPNKFVQICDALAEPSVIAKTYLELIVVYELEWMEEFRSKYPKLSGHGRPIYAKEDTLQSTSFETYLRGELYTYSENTVLAYYNFIKGRKVCGENLILQTMENEVKAYGYSSLEDAEAKL